MRHNKKRNTAFIYETLTRELTKTIIEKDSGRKNKIVAILKEFFVKGTPLARELELYNILLETKNMKHQIAERLMKETKVAHSRLDENVIFDTQSRIIAAINKKLGPDVWATFVPNFKSLASVNAIFNSRGSVKKKVLFEQNIVDTMSEKQTPAELGKMEPIDNLAYGSFIKKFNGKYGNLLQEQKELLNQFITSFADDGFELRLYLNEELSRLKNSLNTAAETDMEPFIFQKINEVIQYVDGFRKREFREEDLNRILKTQELTQELLSND